MRLFAVGYAKRYDLSKVAEMRHLCGIRLEGHRFLYLLAHRSCSLCFRGETSTSENRCASVPNGSPSGLHFFDDDPALQQISPGVFAEQTVVGFGVVVFDPEVVIFPGGGDVVMRFGHPADW